jgi:NADH-quinone oxidoreductase subunit H
LGALRSAAQLVSYEVALSLGLLAGVMVAGTLSLNGLVEYQLHARRWILFSNYGMMAIPFGVYLIAAIAETNRVPFDLPEAESELVAGYHTEFSGFRWALYMLAEWGNILVVCAVAVTLFLGGWLRPFANVRSLSFALDGFVPFLTFAGIAAYCVYRSRKMYYRYEAVTMAALGAAFLLAGSAFFLPGSREQLAGLYWFFLKLAGLIYLFIWMRGSLPRVRYDQLMSFGWKYLIPVGLFALAVNAVLGLI